MSIFINKMVTVCHLGLVKFNIFLACMGFEGHCASAYQISAKLVKLVLRYCKVFYFSRWWLSGPLSTVHVQIQYAWVTCDAS